LFCWWNDAVILLENYQGDRVYYSCSVDLVVIKYCECGCGAVVEKRFVHGHASRKYWAEHRNSVRFGGHKNVKNHSTIDWDAIIAMYGYSSEESFLRSMIQKFRPSKIADSVGVSAPTIRSRLDYYSIPRNHSRGGDHRSYSRKRAFLALSESEIAEMTLSEIAEKVGCSIVWARMLCKKYNRSYRVPSQLKRNLFLDIPKAERMALSRTQLMNRIDCSQTYIGMLCNLYEGGCDVSTDL
jgi:hypothetical protein